MDFSHYYSGKELYGDDFSLEQIASWFEDEKDGYYQLAKNQEADVQGAGYPYQALNDLGLRHIRGRQFKRCLGLGVGGGEDVKSIAAQVERFFCIEPARSWWTDTLHGKPAKYAMPEPDGTIALQEGDCDLAISFGVLHHIPNVTAVLREVGRVSEPGGILILREPIVTMGEWGRPRPGLTKNERGLPIQWLRQTMRDVGFEAVNEQLCGFRPWILAASRLGKSAYRSRMLTYIDALLCDLTAFNARYYRPSFLGNFAPTSVIAVYRKS